MNATISQKKLILTHVGSLAEEETTRQFKWIQLIYWAASLIILQIYLEPNFSFIHVKEPNNFPPGCLCSHI